MFVCGDADITTEVQFYFGKDNLILHPCPSRPKYRHTREIDDSITTIPWEGRMCEANDGMAGYKLELYYKAVHNSFQYTYFD
jgi:hypothetical protein